jgi:hypothetical protein
MKANDLVDLVYAVGGFFSLYPDRSGFSVTVPHGGLAALTHEAVQHADELLPILCEQAASSENLTEAFATLPPDEREQFFDFDGCSERRALQTFGMFASSTAEELIASARPKRKSRFPNWLNQSSGKRVAR